MQLPQRRDHPLHTLGAWLRERRSERGWSVSYAAEMCGMRMRDAVSDNWYRRLEDGARRRLNIYEIDALAATLCKPGETVEAVRQEILNQIREDGG